LEQERAAAKEAREHGERLKAEAQASMQAFHAQNPGAAQAAELESVRTQYLNALATAYPDAGDIQRLQNENPERFQSFVNDFQQLDYDFRIKQANVAAHTSGQQRQFSAAAKQHDDIFERAHPELKDPAVKSTIRREVLSYLAEQGMSEEMAMQNWRGNGPCAAAMRSSMGQELLLGQGT
jgi:hypothetical protein